MPTPYEQYIEDRKRVANLGQQINSGQLGQGSGPRDSYWDSPQTIVEWHRKITNAPATQPPPSWLDTTAINEAYDYLKYRNAGKSEAEWSNLAPGDPAREWIRGLAKPPAEALNSLERQAWYPPNPVGGSPGGVVNPYSTLKEHDAFILGMMSPSVNRDAGTPAEDWGTGIGMATQITLGYMGGNLMGRAVGGAIGAGVGLLAGGVGALPGFMVGQEIGGYIGGVLNAVLTTRSIVTPEAEPVPWVNDTMQFLSLPQFAVEAGIGTAFELSAGQALAEIWKDPKLTWESYKQSGYETNATQVLNAIEPVMAGAWREESQTADPGEVFNFAGGFSDPEKAQLETGAEAPFGAEATKHWRERLGQLIASGVPMREASIQLQSEIVGVYHDSAIANDFVYSTLLDPSNYMTFAGNTVAGKIAGKFGNDNLKVAFERANNMGSQNPAVTLAMDGSGLLQMPIHAVGTLFGKQLRGSYGPTEVMGIYKQMLRDNAQGVKTVAMPPAMATKVAEIYRDNNGQYPAIEADNRTLVWKAKDGTEMRWESPEEFTGGIVARDLTAREKAFAEIDDVYGYKELRPIKDMNWFQKLVNLTPESQGYMLMHNISDAIPTLFEMSGHNWDKVVDMLNVVSGRGQSKNADGSLKYKFDPQTEAFLKSATMRTIAPSIGKVLDDGVIQNSIKNFTSDQGPISDLMKASQALGITPGKFLERWSNADGQNGRAELLKALNEKAKSDPILDVMLKENNMERNFGYFIGDDARIWSPQQLEFEISSLIANSMEDYFRTKLGIKPDSAIFRLNNVMKGVQSLALLGFNPAYLLNNFKNNFVTRMAEGIGGYMTGDQIRKTWERVGYTPARLNEGIGMAGQSLEGIQGFHSGELADIYSSIVGDLMQSKDIIAKAQRTVNKFGKVGVFASLSQRMEQMESSNAMTIGYKKMWARLWVRGDGFGKMDPTLEKALGKEKSDLVYRAIESGMNMDEVMNAVYGDVLHPQLKGIIRDVLAKTGDHSKLYEDMFDALVPELDSLIRTARNEDDVDVIFKYAEKRAEQIMDDLHAREIVDKAEEIKNLVSNRGEGMKAFLQIFGDLEIEYGRKWVTIRQEVQDLYLRRANGEYTYEQFQREWDNLANKQNVEMERFRQLRLQTNRGIIDAIGIKSELSDPIILAIAEQDRIWKEFFSEKDRLWAEFQTNKWDKAKEDFESYRKRTDPLYKEMQDKLEKMYDEATNLEMVNDQKMSEAFGNVFADTFRDGSGNHTVSPNIAQAWREVMMEDYRSKMVDAQKKVRDRTKEQTPAEKKVEYDGYFNDMYDDSIQAFKNAEEIGARWMQAMIDSGQFDLTTDAYKTSLRQFIMDVQDGKIPGEQVKLDMPPGPAHADMHIHSAMIDVMNMYKKANVNSHPNNVIHIINMYREFQAQENGVPAEPLTVAEFNAKTPVVEAKQAMEWYVKEKNVKALNAVMKLSTSNIAKKIYMESNANKRTVAIHTAGMKTRNEIKSRFARAFGVKENDLQLRATMETIDEHAVQFARRYWDIQVTKANREQVIDAYYATHIADIVKDSDSPAEMNRNINRIYGRLHQGDDYNERLYATTRDGATTRYYEVYPSEGKHALSVYDNSPGNFYNTERGGANQRRVVLENPFDLKNGVDVSDENWQNELPLNVQEAMHNIGAINADQLVVAKMALKAMGYDGLVFHPYDGSNTVKVIPFDDAYVKRPPSRRLYQRGDDGKWTPKVFKAQRELDAFERRGPAGERRVANGKKWTGEQIEKKLINSGLIEKVSPGQMADLLDTNGEGWRITTGDIHAGVANAIDVVLHDMLSKTGWIRIAGNAYDIRSEPTGAQIGYISRSKGIVVLEYAPTTGGSLGMTFDSRSQDFYNDLFNFVDVDMKKYTREALREVSQDEIASPENGNIAPEDHIATRSMTMQELLVAIEVGELGTPKQPRTGEAPANPEVVFVGSKKTTDPEPLFSEDGMYENERITKVGGEMVDDTPTNRMLSAKEGRKVIGAKETGELVKKRVSEFGEKVKHANEILASIPDDEGFQKAKPKQQIIRLFNNYMSALQTFEFGRNGKTLGQVMDEYSDWLIGKHPEIDTKSQIIAMMQILGSDEPGPNTFLARELAVLHEEIANTPVRDLQPDPDSAFGFHDWKGIVLPEGTDPSVIKKLQAYGLDVRTHSGDPEAVVDGYYNDPGRSQVKQGEKGAVEFDKDGRATIVAFKSADASTMWHEIGHIFMEDLRLDEYDAVAKHGGIANGIELRRLTREFRKGNLKGEELRRYTNCVETWAKGWERYVIEGYAPTAKMRHIFRNMSQWLLKTYMRIAGIDGKSHSLNRGPDGRVRGFDMIPSFNFDYDETGQFKTVEINVKVGGMSLREIFDGMFTDSPRTLDDLVDARGTDTARVEVIQEVLKKYGSEEEALQALANDQVEPWTLSDGNSADSNTVYDALVAIKEDPSLYKFGEAGEAPAPKPVIARSKTDAKVAFHSGDSVRVEDVLGESLEHDEVKAFDFKTVNDQLMEGIDDASLAFGGTMHRNARAYARMYLDYMYDGKVKPRADMVGTSNAVKIEAYIKQRFGKTVEAYKRSRYTPVEAKQHIGIDPDVLAVRKLLSYELEDGTKIYAGVYKGNRIIALLPGDKILDNIEAPEGYRVLGISPVNHSKYIFIEDATGKILGLDPEDMGMPGNPRVFQMADDVIETSIGRFVKALTSSADRVSLHEARNVAGLMVAKALAMGADPNEFMDKFFGGINDPNARSGEGMLRIARIADVDPTKMIIDANVRADIQARADAMEMGMKEYMDANPDIYKGRDIDEYLDAINRAIDSDKGGVGKNAKTINSVDISADCPMADTMPCMYCYALSYIDYVQGLKLHGSKPPTQGMKMYAFANYKPGTFQQMYTPHMVAELNRVGGLRIFSSGDYVSTRYVPMFDVHTGEEVSTKDWLPGTFVEAFPKDKDGNPLPVQRVGKDGNMIDVPRVWEVNMEPYYDAMINDAKNTFDADGNPLKLKIITKVQQIDASPAGPGRKGGVERFMDAYPEGTTFNLSADWKYNDRGGFDVGMRENFAKDMDNALKAKGVPAKERPAMIEALFDQPLARVRELLDPENWEQVKSNPRNGKMRTEYGETHTLNQVIADMQSNPDAYARGWKTEDISAVRAKYPGKEDKIVVRYVAMNEADAFRAFLDPEIGVVTMYHGVSGRQMYERLMHPKFAPTTQNLGEAGAFVMSRAVVNLRGIETGYYGERFNVFNKLKATYNEAEAGPRMKELKARIDKYFPGEDIDVQAVIDGAISKLCCRTGVCINCTTTCGNKVRNEIEAKFVLDFMDEKKSPTVADISRSEMGVQQVWLDIVSKKQATVKDVVISMYPFFEIGLDDVTLKAIDEELAKYVYAEKSHVKNIEQARVFVNDPKNRVERYRILGEKYERWLRQKAVAQTPSMVKVFKQLGAWLRSIHRLFKDQGRAISPEIDKLFSDITAKGVSDADFQSAMKSLDNELGFEEPVQIIGHKKKFAGGVGKNEVLNWDPSQRQQNPRIFQGEDDQATPGMGDVNLNDMPVNQPLGQGYQELNSRALRPMMSEVKDAYKKAMKTARPLKIGDLPEDVRKGVDNYMARVGGNMASSKLQALRYGEKARDLALLDYKKRYGFDNYLMLASPYELWYTRSMVNWAKRMIDKPAWFNFANNLNKMSEREELQNMPTRFSGKARIPVPWLPDWTGGGLYANPWDQLLPFKQFDKPFNTMFANKAKLEKKAEQILNDMVTNKKIDQILAEQAINSRQGDAWAMAMKQASAELDLTANPTDVIGDMFAPPLWYSYAKNALQGTPEKNSVLPITRTGQAIQGMGQDTAVEPFTNALGGLLSGPETYVRQKSGLSEFGEWGDYSVQKAISDMVGEGKFEWQEGVNAMVEKQGPIWEEARKRVLYETTLRTPGTAPFMAVKEGGNPIDPMTMLATIFPGSIFPEGELKMRGLQQEWKEARADGGKFEDFIDKHPEYQARLALFDEPEERLRQFLVNQIYDKYFALNKADQARARDALGGNFAQHFFQKATMSPDAVDVEQLARWAKILGGMVPKVPETAGVGEVAQPNYYDPSFSARVQTYYDMRDKLYPDYGWLSQTYYNLPKGPQRKAFLRQFPRLKTAWEWSDAFKRDNPDLAPYFNEQSVDAKMESLTNEIDGSLARQLYDYKTRGIALSAGAMAELQRLYKTYGVGMSFTEFLQVVDMLNP